ncbi:MAG: TetR family transcriptional regulator, partial [Anaerolineales bacterium]
MSTRDKILNGALALFNEQGTAAVSTNHIAAAINISPGNLYYHFRNKEDIISALFERLFAAWDETFQLPADRAPEMADIEAMIVGNYQLIWDYRFAYREMAAL